MPKKIVNEEAEILSECHVNKAAGLSNGLCFIYDSDTVSHHVCQSGCEYLPISCVKDNELLNNVALQKFQCGGLSH